TEGQQGWPAYRGHRRGDVLTAMDVDGGHPVAIPPQVQGCRRVDDPLRPPHARYEARGVQEITGPGLDADGGQFRRRGGVPHQCAPRMAVRSQPPRQTAPDVAGGSGQEDAHAGEDLPGPGNRPGPGGVDGDGTWDSGVVPVPE